jgi:nucleoside-diphosphate-sugar epimerase
MAQAAKNAGVKTFVHLSSVMVYGFNYPDRVTEEEPLRGQNNPYCQTKIEAEKELLQLNAPPDFNIIIIRPGDVYGPGCMPWIVRPLLLMRKKLFAYPNGGRGVINHVYVDNLIDAIFLAIEKEAYGEIFNITDGQETSGKEFFRRLAEMEGLPAPSSQPAGFLKFLSWLHGCGRRVLGQEADILPNAVDFLTRPYAYSIAKAQRQLGYQPKISLEEGMQRTHQWLRKTDITKLI